MGASLCIMQEKAQKFIELFAGFSRAHGQTEVMDSQKNGKQQAKSFIVREPLTVELVQMHLEGKKGVGSIPIDENNQCLFGALDIDEYDLDLVKLFKKISFPEIYGKLNGISFFIFI